MNVESVLGFFQELWGKLISVQTPPELWMIILSFGVSLLLVWTPAWAATRNVVTVVHEGGHALMAAIWGRKLSGIKLHSDTSGVTVSKGNPYGLGMIFTAASGYTAPAATAALLAWVLSQGRVVLATLVILFLMFIMFLLIRNIWGAIIVIPLTGGMWLLSQASVDIQTFVLTLVTVFLSVAAIRPIIELQSLRMKGEAKESDADQLQKLTLIIPGSVWVIFFLFVTLAGIALTCILLLRNFV